MNRFLKAAIENMERTETRDAHDMMAETWTQEAIAYALIAIAEAMQVQEPQTKSLSAMDLLSPINP